MILLINVGHYELGCLQLEDHLLRYLTLFRGIDIEYVLGRLFISGANSLHTLCLLSGTSKHPLQKKISCVAPPRETCFQKTLLREIQIEKE